VFPSAPTPATAAPSGLVAWIVGGDADTRADVRTALQLADVSVPQDEDGAPPATLIVLARDAAEAMAAVEPLRARGCHAPVVWVGPSAAQPAEGFAARIAWPVERGLLATCVARLAARAGHGGPPAALFRAGLEAAAEGLLLVDADGRLVRASLPAVRILHEVGVVAPAIGRNLADVVPDSSAHLRDALGRALRGDRTRHVLLLATANGTPRWFELHVDPLTLPDGGPGACVRLRDVDARARREAQAQHEARHDGLTGLANRAHFVERVDTALARGDTAVLHCDVDRFKVVNDSLGPMHGDALLVAFADRLQDLAEGEAVAARLGADEFAVLLPDAGQGAAEALAERIRARARIPFEASGQDVYVSVSIGIALGGPGMTALTLLRDATLAMFDAKSAGGDRIATWDPRLHADARGRVALVADLRRAIAQGAFHLLYQPVMHLPAGRVAGFEALLRWKHPERGIVSPAEFIPLAEETGLIVPLSRVVLDIACRQIRAWLESPHASTMQGITVAVNASGRHFATDAFVADVLEALRRHDIPRGTLEIEITESVAMQNVDHAAHVIESLRGHGVAVSIDDFGAGYSSLAYLHRLPVDFLKIDRSLVDAREERDWAVVRSILGLAAAFGVEVVAEGIETPAQLERLRHLGCTYGQGWHFAKPLPPEDAIGMATRALA
jgi:diguanylate cyclase (GGDEF)-like protein